MAWSRSCAKRNRGANGVSGESSRGATDAAGRLRRSRLTSRTLHDADDDVPDVGATEAGFEQRADGAQRIVRAMLREVVREIASGVLHRPPCTPVDDRTGRIRIPIATVRAGGEDRDAVAALA